MEKFSFRFDEKCTIWIRNTFTIEADSLEEAKYLAQESIQNYKNQPVMDSQELLEDTLYPMTVQENWGRPTQELYTSDNEIQPFFKN